MSEIAAAYDQWSGTYNSAQNATRDLAARVLRQQLPDSSNRHVLEIGCGTGLNTTYLAEQSRSVVAVDFSSGMLAQARASVRANNVRFAQQDIRLRWGVADHAVDLVVCTLVLEHIENLDHVFHEAARVLCPGGEFFVCELHPFRQMRGGQAQFTNAAGQIVRVPAYSHDVSDYVNASVRAGFALRHLGEWRDGDETDKAAPPRLLSLQVRAGRRSAPAEQRTRGFLDTPSPPP